jgi:hypothetical protein
MGRRTRRAAEARRRPAGRRRARVRALAAAWDSACVGAFVGLVVGGMALAAGLVRFALFAFGGRTVEPMTWRDVLTLIVYVLVFVLGGSLVGAVHSLWRNRLATVGAFMAAGALGMNSLAWVTSTDRRYDSETALWMSGLGCIFGLAAAYGMARNRGSADV